MCPDRQKRLIKRIEPTMPMKRKRIHLSLFLLFAACNMAVGQASDGLDEHGYDAHSDTTACYLGRPIQHLTHFAGDTLRLKNGCPSPYQGYHKWQGFTISDFYVTQDTVSFKGMHAAILSPVTMTFMQDDLQDSLFTDRLLIISCEGKRWVYPYFIRNMEASNIMFKEELAADEDGITLHYEAGNGWKYSYTITIGVCFGEPCLLELAVFEHSPGAEYQSVRDFYFGNDYECFPVSRYRRDFPMLLRAGDINKFYVD